MKKRFRIITSLILVTLLVTALASPAMATPVAQTDPERYYNAQGTWGQNTFTLSINYSKIEGNAWISISGPPAYVTAKSKSYVYNERNDLSGYSEEVVVTGYFYAYATSPNEFTDEDSGIILDGEIRHTIGTLSIGSEIIEHRWVK